MDKTKGGANKSIAVKIIYVISFLILAVLTFIGAAKHEIWFDEAQAWNIARDNDIIGIIKMMKCEGHPPLWHFLLKIFTSLGCSAAILPFISWFISMVTAGIILWKSPLHPALNLSMIFSMGFLYANTVVSRVYCIMELALVLWAICFPKRKEHPVLYGVIIALMANTHIMMWGFIAAVGIIMLIELFTEFKKVSKKENIMRIIGLGIAGLGVLMLILPLLGCMSTNTSVARREITLEKIFNSLAWFPYVLSEKFTSYENDYPINYTLCLALSILVLIYPVLVRKNKQLFAIFISFIIGYFITVEVIWWTIVNRACIFFLMYFIILWVTKSLGYTEERSHKLSDKIESKPTRKVLQFLLNIDNRWFRNSGIILVIICISSVPAAAKTLFDDYKRLFSPEKCVGDYFEEHSDEENVIYLTEMEGNGVVASAYHPELKLYSLLSMDFYTYTSHLEKYDEDGTLTFDYDAIEELISGYDHVYYVDWVISTYATSQKHIGDYCMIKSKDDFILLLMPRNACFCIKEFDLEEFKKDEEIKREEMLELKKNEEEKKSNK